MSILEDMKNDLLELMKTNASIYREYEKQIERYISKMTNLMDSLKQFIVSNNFTHTDYMFAYILWKTYHVYRRSYLEWSLFLFEIRRYLAMYNSTVSEFKSNIISKIKNVQRLQVRDHLQM